MAKKPKTTPEAGHNSGLSDDERADLFAHFAFKIRAGLKKAAATKAIYDADRDAVNALFSSARGELRLTRKEFEEVLAAQDMSEAEFLNNEKKRQARFAMASLPVGAQLDMFAEPKDAASDQARAFNDGKRAGLRGDDPKVPDYISSVFHPDWTQGWHEGQTAIGDRMVRAMTILNEREQKAGKLKADETAEAPAGGPTAEEQDFGDDGDDSEHQQAA